MLDDNEYKVIRILSPEKILINYGYNDGAKIGTKVRVVEEADKIIFDSNYYGTYDYIKEILEIVEVHPQFSECQKIKITPSEFARNLSSISKFNELFSSTEEIAELSVNNKQIEEISPPSEFSKIISLGDPIRILNIDK